MDEYITLEVPEINGTGLNDDDPFLGYLRNKYPKLRDWSFTDPLRESTANIVRGFRPSNMEIERLHGLVGLDDEAFRARNQDRLLGLLPQNVRDDYLRGQIESLTEGRERVGKIADAIAPTPHAQPDSLLGKAGYTALEMIPHIAAAVPMIHALGPMGYAGVNTFTGNQSAQENVYDALRSQGLSPDEAYQQATAFTPNAIDALIRGGANFGTMGLLSKTPVTALQRFPYAGAVSPYAQTAGNIAMASGVSGLGAMGEQALTNYRTNTENDIAELAKTGLKSAAITGGIGFANAAFNWRNLRELQRQYWENANAKPIAYDWPGGDGSGNASPNNPNNPNNNGGGDFPQVEVMTPEKAARLQKQGEVLTKYKLPPETDLWKGIKDGSIPDDTAVNILVDMGAKPDIAKSLVTGSKTLADIERGANNLSRGVPKSAQETPRQPQTFKFNANEWQDPLFPKSRPVKTMDKPDSPNIGTPSETPQTNTSNSPTNTTITPPPAIPPNTAQPQKNSPAWRYQGGIGSQPADKVLQLDDDDRLLGNQEGTFRNGTLTVPDAEGNPTNVYVQFNGSKSNPAVTFSLVPHGTNNAKEADLDVAWYDIRRNQFGALARGENNSLVDPIIQQFRQHLGDFFTPNKTEQTPQTPTLTALGSDKQSQEQNNPLSFEEFKAAQANQNYGYQSILRSIADNNNKPNVVRGLDGLEDILQPPHKVTALGETQQPKAESGGIAEDLKNIVESNTTQQSQTKLQPVGKPFLDVQDELGRVKQVTNPEAVKIRDSNLQLLDDAENDEERIRLLNTLTHQQLKDMADTGAFGVNYHQGQTKKDFITSIIERRNRRKEELKREEEKRGQTTAKTPVPPSSHNPDTRIPHDAYLKDGILAFSYYPEGSKRKQDARFTVSIDSTQGGYKSIRLKSKKFGDYAYYPDFDEFKYKGNNPEGEKLLPTVKKEFLRQIKNFYVDREKNSNRLPVLEKGDIAIQGRNSRLQTQDAIILRPRNLNHNDGKFDVIAVSNNGVFAGTLAHHGTFEGHSYIPPKNSHFSKDYLANMEELIRSELRKKFSIIPERAVIRNKNGYIDISDMAPPYGSEVRITRDNSKFTVIPHPKSRFFTFHFQNSKKKKPYAYYYPDSDSFILEEDERDRGLLYMLEKRFREKIKDFYYGGDEENTQTPEQPQQDSKPVTTQAETTVPQTQEERPTKLTPTGSPFNILVNGEIVPPDKEKSLRIARQNLDILRNAADNDERVKLLNSLTRDQLEDWQSFLWQLSPPVDLPGSPSRKKADYIKSFLKLIENEKNPDSAQTQTPVPSPVYDNVSPVRVVSFNDKHENEKQPEQQQQKSPETENTSNDSSMPDTPITRLANRVKARILDALDEDKDINPFSNDDLLKWAAEEFGGTKGQGAFDPREAYDAMEMGINLAIAEAGITPGSAEDTYDVVNDIQRLLRILQTIPTQTNRTKEQVAFQQFSTPPTLAYLVNWLASIGGDNIALEPSAGTGNLAVFAHNAGAGLILNDYSNSGLRADILDSLRWGEVYRKDALDIADILLPQLDDDERPDRVIMNPPFSAAGKQGTANSNQNGFQHVEQALQLLKDNGRLVAILGAGRDGTASSVKTWLKHIGKTYNVRALITVGGKAYQRYGTTFDNAVVVIDKMGATPKGGTVEYKFSGDFNSFDDVKALFDALADIHNDIDNTSKFLKWDEAIQEKNTQTNETNNNAVATLKDFKEAFDENDKGRIFVRICDIRRTLGWPREVFDNMIENLWSKKIIQPHTGDASLMTLDEVADCFYHQAMEGLTFRYGSVTWNNYNIDVNSHEFDIPYSAQDKKQTVIDNVNHNANSRDYSVEAFKEAFDALDHGRIFVKIPDLRRKLNWPRKVFDGMLRDLRDKEIIQLHTGDASLMTPDEVADCFIDENNFRKGSVTWHVYNRNDDDEPDNDSNTPKPEPSKPTPAPKNDTPKAEAKTETTAQAQQEEPDLADLLRHNDALKSIYTFLHEKEEDIPYTEKNKYARINNLLFNIDNAIKASMEQNFRNDEQKRRRICRAIYNTLLEAGIDSKKAEDWTRYSIFSYVMNKRGYDNEHPEDTEHTRKEIEEILAKIDSTSYDELKDTAESLGVDVHSTVGTRDDSEGNRAKLRTAIKKALKADSEPATQQKSEEAKTSFHLKETEEILAKLHDASFDELKDIAESLGVDVSFIGSNTAYMDSYNRAILRMMIAYAQNPISALDYDKIVAYAIRNARNKHEINGIIDAVYINHNDDDVAYKIYKSIADEIGMDKTFLDDLSKEAGKNLDNRSGLNLAIKTFLNDYFDDNEVKKPLPSKKEKEQSLPEPVALPEPVTEIKPQKYVSRKKSEQPDDNDSSEDESPSIYSDYEPQEHSGIHLFDIAKQHPSQLVETTNMKAVHLPPLTYSPHLPDKMIQSGAISEAQLEAVAYAGQAFTQKLPSGQTKGFILGDGAGSGKGRTIAAIITDQLNQNHGGGKAVWFSVSADLFKDAQRDLENIGEDKKQLFELGETKLGDTIPTAKKGIMFTTYNTLIRTGKKKNDDNNTDNDSESDKSAEEAIDTKRIKQIVDWLGEDFDGVVAFDECHKINNLGGENSGFGISAPSQSADAARKLADALPHARILYVSATSATDPNNLRMFDRTGLWGENTPFANADKFAADIKAGGPNAMEMFARDAKSLGVFVARSLSPKGLTYRRLNYKLSKTERDMYNEVAQAWRTVDDAITQGFQAVGGDAESGKKDKGLNTKFRGRQLQCFNFLLTAFKTNALIEDAKKQLDDGNSVAIQIDSTYDAFIDRILKGKQKGDDLRDVIISPIEDLIGFVMDYFPIYKMRQVVHERPNGDKYITNEIVRDTDTNQPVVSQAALKIRNTLIAHLKRVRFNMSPLDRIINSLGGLANVAEVTRRKHRLIEQADGKIIDAKQPPSANKEVDAFNNGEKRVIIFSRAGNTGRSFHADKSFKNSQRRIHYLLEGGFSAFNAIQGFGRTHRSNESSQPEYVVVAADIPGEIRFISAIVRKLGQMGALTAGDRKNNTQGLYSEKDNMESRLAAKAMNRVMGNLLAGYYPEFPNGDEVIRQMGFDPNTFGEKDIPLKRIFNRILSLDLEIQDVLISYFNMEHEQLLLMAIQNGTADIGTENIRALDCETIQDKTILEDKAKGIKTKYLELKVKVKSRIRSFENVTRAQHCKEFFIDQYGTIYAAKKNGQFDTDEEGNTLFRPSFEMKNGEPIQLYTLFTTDMNTRYATDALALQNKKQNQKRLFTPVSRERAKELWQSQSSSIEKSHFETIHMISGVLLPIWNQLKQLKSSRVKRVILPDGTSIIGRILEESEVKNVLRSFRVDYEGKTYTVQDVLRELEKPKTFARLSNNWKLKYSRVSGEKRIEILYNDYHDIPRLQKLGALVEIIGSDERAFVPVGNNDVLHSVITFNNVTGFENDSSADDILDEAAQKINSNIPDSAKLYFIHPSFWGFGATPAEASDNPLIHTSNYPMDSDEREYRYQKSKEADSSKSAWQHIKEFGSKVWKGRHDIPELANEKGRIDDSLIKAQEWLRGLKRERQANVHEAEKRLRAALLGLSPDDFDLFQRAMELRDLYETRKSDPNASMPWGLNPKTLYDFDATDPVYDNYENIMGHVRKNPRVQEAMKKADTLIEDLRDKLVEAAERLGMFDVRDRLRRKHYFRHLVLEYYNTQRGGKPHPTFKNPERRGYTMHRKGHYGDISSNWLLAMGEVFTRMTDDIKILDTLFKLRNEYDIIETLKQQAFQTNMNNALSEIMKGLKDVPDELRKSKAEEQLQAVLQARQARAMSRLFKLAQNGDLPIGNNNEWQELAGRMADAGQLEKLSREEQQKLSRYIGWLSALDDKTKARSAARSFLSGTRSKNAVLKKITGNNFVDWKDLIPDDYTLWSPSDSRLVFSASTTPEYMLKIAMDNIDELLDVPLSDLGKAIATGGNKQLWCIPTRLADALDNIGKSQPMGAFGQIMTKMMGAFKRWVTISPVNGRLFKYNWRNFFGDLEAVLQGNPGALYYFNQAAKELTDVMLKGGIATGTLEEFQKRGGGLTTEAMTELERPDRIKEFSHLFEQKKTSNPLKWGVKALREYLYIATTLTNFRESILRYAAFLSYIQLIKDNNGVPPFYGMSKPREVKAVGNDIYDIAFKLANENLGAYDQISSNLQWLRDNNFVSFMSWVEVNTKRAIQMYANIWQGNSYLEWWLKRKGQKFIDDLIGGGAGNGNGGNNEPPKGNNGGDFADDNGDNNFRKLFRKLAKKSAVGALRLAITLALAAPLWVMLSIWNMLNGENDEKLPPDVRNKPHLTIGTNAFTGEVMYMGDVGSAFDALQMFGVGNLITGDLRDLLDGRATFGEIAANIIDGPVSKLVSNANPFAKAVVEGFFGKRTFPSALHPTTIRDKGRFIAQSFGLEWYYDFLTDKPHKPFYDFSSSVVNTSNQDSSAYFYMLSRRKQFEENVLGKSVDAFTMTRRGEALRNAKRAADLGDRKSLRTYLREYFRAGGSEQGLKISARTMEPLYGLNDTDEMRFIRWLPNEERKILRRAMRYAERMKARLGVW